MKRAFLLRGGTGIGDLLMTTPLPRLLLAQGYEVDVGVWPQNRAVYEHNPFVRALVPYPASEAEFPAWQEKIIRDYDRVVDLGYTVEKRFLHRTDGFFGPIPSLEERRAAAAGKNYYLETLRAAGFEEPAPRPEIYISREESDILNRYRLELAADGRQQVFWHLNGSTKNKFLVKGLQYVKAVLAAVPDSIHHLITGMNFEAHNLPDDPRVRVANWDLRTSILLTQLVDVVIGPESGLVNAAGAFNTPKVVLYSHSAPENLGKFFVNHYPICPECDCHPCYLIPLDWRETWDPQARAQARQFDLGCRMKLKGDPYRSVGYRCTWELPDQQIIDTVINLLKENHHGPDHG